MLPRHRSAWPGVVLAAASVVALSGRGCGGRSERDGAGGGGSGATVSWGAAGDDAGCHRDPYLPDAVSLPCVQPIAVPDCTEGWCTIEPGCFFMGSPWCEWGRARDTDDPLQVTLTHRFLIQQFELTLGEWTAAGLPSPATSIPPDFYNCTEDACPVANVTWYEAAAYANLRSRAEGLPECYALEQCTGELGGGQVCLDVATTTASMYDCLGYRVPTGAEWEYAARAGTKTSAYTGDVLGRGLLDECYAEPLLEPIAWYCTNAGGTTHPVGLKAPNAFGLHDMLGNVSEWATSVYGLNAGGPYIDWGAELPLVNGSFPPEGLEERGMSFIGWPNLLSTSRRFNNAPDWRSLIRGFRLVRTIE